jgi:anaerobic selenocysteine-containing dehydrogenase
MDSVLKPRVSRRTFLRAGVAAGGAILGFTSTAGAAAAKVAKQAVSYQPSPKGPAHCAACTHFQAPSGCNLVDGPISPTGWCVLFKPK